VDLQEQAETEEEDQTGGLFENLFAFPKSFGSPEAHECSRTIIVLSHHHVTATSLPLVSVRQEMA
jgi:hypothetical protein